MSECVSDCVCVSVYVRVSVCMCVPLAVNSVVRSALITVTSSFSLTCVKRTLTDIVYALRYVLGQSLN